MLCWGSGRGRWEGGILPCSKLIFVPETHAWTEKQSPEHAASPLVPPPALVCSFNIAGVNDFPCSKPGIPALPAKEGFVCWGSCCRVAIGKLLCKTFATPCLPAVALVTKLMATSAPAPVQRRKTKPFVLPFQRSSAGLSSGFNVMIKTIHEPQSLHTCGFIHSHRWLEVQTFQLGLL